MKYSNKVLVGIGLMLTMILAVGCAAVDEITRAVDDVSQAAGDITDAVGDAGEAVSDITDAVGGAGKAISDVVADLTDTIDGAGGAIDNLGADGSNSTEATPTPDGVVPTPEPISTPTPTITPAPDYAAMYRDDVVAAVTRYWAAWNAHDQVGINSALTNSSVETGLETIEEYKAASFAGRGWPDYPHITIKEVTYIMCDEVLCKLLYIIHSVPPDIGASTAAPFDADSYSWVRLVDGVWLNDKSVETWHDGFESTHRK